MAISDDSKEDLLSSIQESTRALLSDQRQYFDKRLDINRDQLEDHRVEARTGLERVHDKIDDMKAGQVELSTTLDFVRDAVAKIPEIQTRTVVTQEKLDAHLESHQTGAVSPNAIKWLVVGFVALLVFSAIGFHMINPQDAASLVP